MVNRNSNFSSQRTSLFQTAENLNLQPDANLDSKLPIGSQTYARAHEEDTYSPVRRNNLIKDHDAASIAAGSTSSRGGGSRLYNMIFEQQSEQKNRVASRQNSNANLNTYL